MGQDPEGITELRNEILKEGEDARKKLMQQEQHDIQEMRRETIEKANMASDALDMANRTRTKEGRPTPVPSAEV